MYHGLKAPKYHLTHFLLDPHPRNTINAEKLTSIQHYYNYLVLFYNTFVNKTEYKNNKTPCGANKTFTLLS